MTRIDRKKVAERIHDRANHLHDVAVTCLDDEQGDTATSVRGIAIAAQRWAAKGSEQTPEELVAEWKVAQALLRTIRLVDEALYVELCDLLGL